jgi:hypothetical protein
MRVHIRYSAYASNAFSTRRKGNDVCIIHDFTSNMHQYCIAVHSCASLCITSTSISKVCGPVCMTSTCICSGSVN